MENKDLAKRIALDVDAFSVKEFDDGPRWHLGASQMGKSCNRQLWYQFRWVKHEIHSSRLYRLFQRGHREEPFMVKLLKGIGCQVWDTDTSQPQNEDGTFPQWRISDVQGHFGGSLDCIAKFPVNYNLTIDTMPISFKTNGTGAKFQALRTKGLILTKPDHHIQESIYCFKMNYPKYGYMNVCKNDDDLFIDIQDADFKEAERQIKRAEVIIFSKTPPARISENKSFFDCQYCTMQQICHDGAPTEKNCRSCSYASPVDAGQWQCSGFNAVIPKDFVSKGCDNWTPICGT